jgi:hypothetical protein
VLATGTSRLEEGLSEKEREHHAGDPEQVSFARKESSVVEDKPAEGDQQERDGSEDLNSRDAGSGAANGFSAL